MSGRFMGCYSPDRAASIAPVVVGQDGQRNWQNDEASTLMDDGSIMASVSHVLALSV